MKRAFVAGATGYTGREVVRQLCARGVHTLASIRPGSRSAARWVPTFEGWGAVVEQIPWDPEALTAALRAFGPDVVFSLIGTTRAAAKRDAVAAADIYDAVDFALTAMLIDAARACEGPPHFVYLSSIGASPTASSRYLAARGRAEAHLAAAGVPYTSARPSLITGPDRDERRTGERLAGMAANALLAVPGALGARRLRDRYRSIDNVGLATALIAAAQDPACRDATLEGDAIQRLARGPAAIPAVANKPE